MGKKSKKGAAAKAKAGVGDDVAAVTAAAGVKKLKCIRCCGNIKDAAKAVACPGCYQLFCWRCEKKNFEECPNGSACICPAWRCSACFTGAIFRATVEDTEKKTMISVPPQKQLALFHYLRDSGKIPVTAEATPFQMCGAKDCLTQQMECYRCLADTAVPTRLVQCAVCQRIRCHQCKDAGQAKSQIPDEIFALLEGGANITVDNVAEAALSVKTCSSDAWAACVGCKAHFCIGCLDDESARLFVMSMVSMTRTYSGGVPGNTFKCGHCYWSSKPCTNPNCPNKVGIPTKRCGDCHLDRYCSVECQVAAYPGHVARCQRIHARRAAAGKV